MARSAIVFFLGFAWTLPGLADSDWFLPQPVAPAEFSALRKQSPFTRTVNATDSLILTGIATVDSKPVATLLNTETRESYVLTETPNQLGWKMVDFRAGNRIEDLTARISVGGGQEVNIRYVPFKFKPKETRKAAGSGKQTDAQGPDRNKRDSDGAGAEIREKVSSLSQENREKFIKKMREMHQQQPDLSPEQRMQSARKMLENFSANSNN